MWLVVKFPTETDCPISVIPISWQTSDKTTKWPKKTLNMMNLLRTQSVPAKDWFDCEIEIKEKFDSFEKALKYERKYSRSLTSDVEMTETDRSEADDAEDCHVLNGSSTHPRHSKRKRTATLKFPPISDSEQSEEEKSEDEDVRKKVHPSGMTSALLPPGPPQKTTIQERLQPQPQPHLHAPSFSGMTPPPTTRTGLFPTPQSPAASNTGDGLFQEKVLTMLEDARREARAQRRALEKLQTEVQTLRLEVQRAKLGDGGDDGVVVGRSLPAAIQKVTPARTEKDLKALDKFLGSKENYSVVLGFLTQEGGKDAVDLTKRVMRLLVGQSVCQEVTYRGYRGKPAFVKNEKVVGVVVDVVLKKFRASTKDEVEKAVSDWLRNWKDREPKQAKKAAARTGDAPVEDTEQVVEIALDPPAHQNETENETAPE